MIDASFERAFAYSPERTDFTPGRVNLIGEHTDYNGGMVLPTALELGVIMSLARRDDDKIRVYSDKFDDREERHLKDTATEQWSDYVTGAIILANSEGLLKGGADIAIQSTLPFGAGISSSAAVAVGVLKLARSLSGSPLSDTDIALLAQRVENEFIGMPCGIMDQMAVAIAHPGQALALDTRSLEFDLVNLPDDHHMAVIHSGQFRKLNEGRYQERKEECDAVKIEIGHNNICLLSDLDLESLNHLPDHIQRRAQHCASEHRRTRAAVTCLRDGDLVQLGALMNESHISMRDDFEITVPAVDQLVEDAVTFGALGARQTGGGFGGCIVACVPKASLDEWRTALLSKHTHAFWVA